MQGEEGYRSLSCTRATQTFSPRGGPGLPPPLLARQRFKQPALACTRCGPTTIHQSPPPAVDASDDSFRFYSGGVYHNPDCHTKAADLDHAVIIRWARADGAKVKRLGACVNAGVMLNSIHQNPWQLTAACMASPMLACPEPAPRRPCPPPLQRLRHHR